MKRKHLIRKPLKKLEWYTPMKEPFSTRKPGENVQLDVKYVPSRHGEWLYQFRFLDAAINMQYVYESEPWKTIREYTTWYNNQRYHLGKNLPGLTPH